MPRCVFCLKEYDNLTDEHVFPAVFGGNLVLPNAACQGCNNGFSKAFEQSIADHFVDFRRLLLIPDRRGKVPEIFVEVEAEGKKLEAKLLPSGQILLKPIVTVVKINGGTEIKYEHATDKQKERLQKEAREKGFDLIEEPAPAQEVEVNISGDLKFIDSNEMFRLVTKIAYVALALRMGEKFASSEIFSQPRRYALTGAEPAITRLFLHEEFLQACQQGPHQHSVILVGRNEHRRVDAIVRLFGALTYHVLLANKYEGADFYNTLAYDAQRGEENKVLVLNEQAEFLQIEEITTSRTTIWNDRVASGESFLRFIAAALHAELIE
jgi:HNH endonuclease